MSFYTAMCSQLLFPLHERLKGHDSVAWRARLEESQWWSAAQLADYRVERLRDFLVDIGQHVPYYRDLFSRLGFVAESVNSLDALLALPLLDKPDIRANVERLKADGHGPLMRYNTGGSSGEPLIFYMGKARKSHDVAAKWRATRWWDVDIGDRELVVWGSPVELGAQDRIRRLRDGLLRSHLLPAFEMSLANLDRFVDTIRATRPAILFGYPSSLSLIALHARQKNIEMSRLGIKVAFVTSEKLYDEQRAVISEVFGCPVANGYGARDAGFIAHECPSGSLHISAEDLVVETLRPDGTPTSVGEAGEIVVTHLATAEFPFVRYRTGDVGVLASKSCACGRGLPVLEEISGRSTDFVVAHDGTVMHGLALIYTVRDLPGVERFKIEQLSIDQTVVQLVTGPAFDRQAEERIVRDFKARLGQAVDIRVIQVADIANESSGKFRYVVSHVKPYVGGRTETHA
ncbi:phenylacetate--CoA ligase family protein [Candidatus Accumulibacter sp. ACC003]|uniref:phenylacetate--CoA ligase family protein n=1 Tax=Candidatus Accumulibacter sp. ACC003 TaxID=2823334 RepID=UPI0025BE2636|nr:phenylacetate--CoA ligase family protein [Candidatus Accumulibacter sp. ACC003]